MSEHTPGPWEIDYDNSDLSGGGQWYTVGPAEVWFPYNCSPQREEKAKADAVLIASAPDLLDFAELVARMTTDQEMDGEMLGDDAVSTLSELIETARTLRNKAKGLT